MSDDEFRQMMAAFSAEFCADLPSRIESIDSLWGQIIHGEHMPQRMEELIRVLHKIAGSAATFGFPLSERSPQQRNHGSKQIVMRRSRPMPQHRVTSRNCLTDCVMPWLGNLSCN